MSSIFRSATLLLVSQATAFLGCDSDITDEPNAQAGAASGGGGSTAASGAGGDGGSTSSTDASSSSASAAGGASMGCDNALQYIDNLYQAAAACSPDDGSLHCQDAVEGHCCMVLVDSLQSPATQAYLDFLDLTRRQCPEIWVDCQTVKCGQPPVGSCVPDDSQAGGHCMPSP